MPGPSAPIEALLPPGVVGPAFLRDGTEVWVRPAIGPDRDLLLELLEREPSESLAFRFGSAIRPELAEEEIARIAPPEDRLCLLALGDRSGRAAVLGVGEYARLGPGAPAAEIAFLVAAPFRRRGIASLLLARLARAAEGFGILRFEARVRADNPEMLEVFRGCGRPLVEAGEEGEVLVQIPLVPDAGSSSGEPIGADGPGAAAGSGAGARRSLARRQRQLPI
jgi:GNAT superfamily N-acetyltransferase